MSQILDQPFTKPQADSDLAISLKWKRPLSHIAVQIGNNMLWLFIIILKATSRNTEYIFT